MAEFRTFIDAKGLTKVGVVEAQQFLSYIKKQPSTSLIGEFNAAWAARKQVVADEMVRLSMLKGPIHDAEVHAVKAKLKLRTIGVTVAGIVGLQGLNAMTRKVMAEGKSVPTAGVEFAKETATGVAETPGMIKDAAVGTVEAAQEWQKQVRREEIMRREIEEREQAKLARGEDFRPYAGVKREADAIFSPINSAVEGAGDIWQGIKNDWLWWNK